MSVKDTITRFPGRPFLYGTAWKEDRTKQLTRLAIEQGFRGIDTANQRKHYCEVAVGDAIKESIRDRQWYAPAHGDIASETHASRP